MQEPNRIALTDTLHIKEDDTMGMIHTRQAIKQVKDKQLLRLWDRAERLNDERALMSIKMELIHRMSFEPDWTDEREDV